MTNCLLKLIDGKWTCPICNWVYRLESDRPPRRNCPAAKSRGLGDTIAKITHKLGLRKCGGCKRRQAKLNELIPYRGE